VANASSFVFECSIAHGVLDRPVEPGDDTVGLLWSPNPKAAVPGGGHGFGHGPNQAVVLLFKCPVD
jgi:hypothetical protein